MTDFAARISRVRMKEGADIHVLHTPREHLNENGEAENLRGKIIEHAKQVAAYDEPTSTLDGFLVIGLYHDGSASVGFRLPARIPSALAPAYIAEMLRRDAVTSRESQNTFNRMFYWQDRAS